MNDTSSLSATNIPAAEFNTALGDIDTSVADTIENSRPNGGDTADDVFAAQENSNFAQAAVAIVAQEVVVDEIELQKAKRDLAAARAQLTRVESAANAPRVSAQNVKAQFGMAKAITTGWSKVQNVATSLVQAVTVCAQRVATGATVLKAAMAKLFKIEESMPSAPHPASQVEFTVGD